MGALNLARRTGTRNSGEDLRKGKLADFKYWKGCKTEKGPAPSRRLLRTDPGPARGKWGADSSAKETGGLAEGSSSPALETFRRISAQEGPPAQPPTQSRDPSSDFLSDGLRPLPGGHQGKLPASAAKTRAQKSWHHPPAPLQRRTEVKTFCLGVSPSTGPGRAFQKVAPAPCTWPVALPRGSVTETAEQRGSNKFLASGEQRSSNQGWRECSDGPCTRTRGAVLRVTTHPSFPGTEGPPLPWDLQVPTPGQTQADPDGWSSCSPGAPLPPLRGAPFSPFHRWLRRWPREQRRKVLELLLQPRPCPPPSCSPTSLSFLQPPCICFRPGQGGSHRP
nr:uncharacterized protein LOC129046489 [Mirounga angustirostris]